MKGYIYVTSSGYDPQLGKHIKDPYLGKYPTLGACMPNIRRQVIKGDRIFVVSGKVEGAPQYVIGGFEVADKITAMAAYKKFPEMRLKKREDGQLTGNIIVNSRGKQHAFDSHSNFERRIENYIVGRNPVVLTTDPEIERGRVETLEMLQRILCKTGKLPVRIIGRGGSKLDNDQVIQLEHWLQDIIHAGHH